MILSQKPQRQDRKRSSHPDPQELPKYSARCFANLICWESGGGVLIASPFSPTGALKVASAYRRGIANGSPGPQQLGWVYVLHTTQRRQVLSERARTGHRHDRLCSRLRKWDAMRYVASHENSVASQESSNDRVGGASPDLRMRAGELHFRFRRQ